MLVTKETITYHTGTGIFSIPKGVPVTLATNLVLLKQHYWVEPWEGMSAQAESWQRNYGFLVRMDEVETISCMKEG